MHCQTLFMITALVASVAGAPVPVSAPVLAARAESLAAREAFDAALSPVLVNLKREILERLESAMPVKRQDDIWGDENSQQPSASNGAEKRNDVDHPEDIVGKREDGGITGNAENKRQLEYLQPDSEVKRTDGTEPQEIAEKRQSYDVNTDAPQKRQSYDVNTDAPQKRQSYDVNTDAPQKRQSYDVNTDAPQKRQSYDVNTDAPQKRQSYEIPQDAPNKLRRNSQVLELFEA